jgi:hypothetical protein
MAIEIRHLTIKSTIVDDRRHSQVNEQSELDIEDIKEQLLAECKQLIAENMRSGRER